MFGLTELILALLLFSPSWAGPIIALEEEELTNYVKKNQIVMVDMYIPNCPHCKALAPEFLKAAKKAKQENKPYSFVKINGEENPGLGATYKISGYPTIVLFINGNPIKYEGERNADAILEFIDKKNGQISTPLSTVEEIQKVVSEDGLRVILPINAVGNIGYKQKGFSRILY